MPDALSGAIAPAGGLTPPITGPDASLFVFHRGRMVGRISAEPLEFAYEASWLRSKSSFPVSVALPLRARAFPEGPVRAFFFNLLPEGGVRRRLAGRLGISEGNDYALLAAIGGECAGALTVLTRAQDDDEEGEYEALSDAELARRLASGGALSSVAGEKGVRLSLAGAQDKLPVYLDEDGLFLPRGNAPSSHILKFESRDFKQLPTNEVFLLRLAEAVGLKVVRSTLKRLGRASMAVIERYDRVRTSGVLERLHQEDLCQALGVPAERKYQAEGGPSFSACVELVRAHSSEPLVDAHALIRWQLFNAIVGNADGHAKNLALLHGPSGTRLAPFYDLVCTRAYPRVARTLAMSIGGDREVVRKRDWPAFADAIGVGQRYLRETAAGLLAAAEAVVPETLRAFEEEFGRKDFLRSAVVPAVRAGMRQLQASLKR